MPRGNRYFIPGQVYHITHRCHDRQFLLRFAADRTAYRERLREVGKEEDVSLLDYSITSNHTHLVATSETEAAIARFMQRVAGEVAQSYNRRRNRSGAFWEDRYHATLIERGSHLLRCFNYLALQMVRCFRVQHPSEWKWCGYHELMGLRTRYRLLDTDRLLQLLGTGSSLEAFRIHYESRINELISQKQLQREPQWSESIAVGSESFVQDIATQIRGRQELEIARSGEAWCLHDATTRSAYNAFSPQKNAL